MGGEKGDRQDVGFERGGERFAGVGVEELDRLVPGEREPLRDVIGSSR